MLHRLYGYALYTCWRLCHAVCFMAQCSSCKTKPGDCHNSTVVVSHGMREVARYSIASSVARLIKHLIHAKLADRYGTCMSWSHIGNLECHLTSTTANMLPRGCSKRFVSTATHGSGFNDQLKINRYWRAKCCHALGLYDLFDGAGICCSAICGDCCVQQQAPNLVDMAMVLAEILTQKGRAL